MSFIVYAVFFVTALCLIADDLNNVPAGINPVDRVAPRYSLSRRHKGGAPVSYRGIALAFMKQSAAYIFILFNNQR